MVLIRIKAGENGNTPPGCTPVIGLGGDQTMKNLSRPGG